MKKKKLLESFQQEKPQKQKKKVWKNYDFENLPILTNEQIGSFKKVTSLQHSKFKKAVSQHFGRPKKDPALKENIVSIRFSDVFLKKIKKKATSEGYTGWQTFTKKVLEDYLSSH